MLTTDLIQLPDPAVVVSDDQDATFTLSMEDGTDLTGVPVKLTIREDPQWATRPKTGAALANPDDDPSEWAAVVTATGTGDTITAARATMAALSPGRYRYVLEVSRLDSGSVSPVVPPTWLSVRAAVSR